MFLTNKLKLENICCPVKELYSSVDFYCYSRGVIPTFIAELKLPRGFFLIFVAHSLMRDMVISIQTLK